MVNPVRSLRLVGPRLELREVCLASWHAAKTHAKNHAVPLTPASAAGFCVVMAGDARTALERLTGSDDWTVQVRNHLRRVAEEERAGGAPPR
jgi:hypothetical protein